MTDERESQESEMKEITMAELRRMWTGQGRMKWRETPFRYRGTEIGTLIGFATNPSLFGVSSETIDPPGYVLALGLIGYMIGGVYGFCKDAGLFSKEEK